MSKIAFIFPGQGAQVNGMGKDIIGNDPTAKKIFEQANEVLDFDLYDLCFNDNDLINDTAYTQPALLAVSVAVLKVVQSYGIQPDYVAGLSLGEYSALVAGGYLSFDEAIDIVRKRGRLMQKAAEETTGSMAAVIGSDKESIQEILSNVEGYVTIANYNSSKQIVVAGEKEAVEASVELFKASDIRCIPLNVSGAFHSDLMNSASVGLKEVLEDVTIHEGSIPYLTNVTGQIVTDITQTKSLLIEQVKASVMWETCVQTMIANGVDTFIEIGPGKTLAGLIKKIDRKKRVIGVSDMASCEALKSIMEEV